MNSKMTANSQLLTTTPKTKTQLLVSLGKRLLALSLTL